MKRKAATDALEIAVSDSTGLRVLQLTGEFDLAGVAQFERLLDRDSISVVPTFVLDMRGVTFLDSSGLRALIMADHRIRAEGGRLIVIKGPHRVHKVLELAGVAERIELVDEPPAGLARPG